MKRFKQKNWFEILRKMSATNYVQRRTSSSLLNPIKMLGLSSIILLVQFALGQNIPEIPFSPQCTKQNLPVTVGGTRDDVARCMVYDPANELIIVGGETRSSDFGPANSKYGFLYAINLDGDWAWGNYFRNTTGEVSEISGCQLSSDGKQVIVLGTTREQVVMAVVNATNGRMNNLYSLENRQGTKKGSEPPKYKTYGAIILDSKDERDDKAYIYASFLMDEQQQLVKILQAIPDRTNEFPVIKYHFSMLDFTESENEEDFVRQKTPQYMFALPQKDYSDSYYMSGTYRGLGSIMKFYKKNGILRWHAQLDSMTKIDAIAVQDNTKHGKFFGCGSNNYDDRGISLGLRPSDSEAWFFSMEADGKMNWLLKLAGATTDSDTLLSDSCQGMVFNAKTDRVIVVIETDSPQFRVQSNNSQRDTMLVEIKINGVFDKVISFTLGSNNYDMLSFPQNLVFANDYYYMGGLLYGFQTTTQVDQYNDRTKDLDTFLFPLRFLDRPTDKCFADKLRRGSDLQPFGTFYNKRSVQPKYQLFKNEDRAVPKTQQSDRVFGLNYSKFIQTRPLRSFVRTPRPCAFQSLKLSDQPVEYLRGSETLKYMIADESVYAPLITQMAPKKGGVTQIIDQTGKETQLAQFSAEHGGEIDFYTNVARQMGLNELIIKHCDIYERLFDLRLQIDVKMNTQPVFKDFPQRVFQLAVNETLLYRLPEIIDPQGNAKTQILVEAYTNYTDLFPPFLIYFNGNKTFEFIPDKDEYAGQSYFFKVILKEEGSSVIGNQFTFQVFVDEIISDDDADSDSGGDQQPDTNEEKETTEESQSLDDQFTGRQRQGNVIKTDSFEQQQENLFQFIEIYTTDIVGRTRMKFTQPVNMTQIEEDIDQLFTLFVQKSDYFYNPKNITLKEISYTNFNVTNQTVDLAFKFEDPFELGLNIEKSDFVLFFFNETIDWSQVLQVPLLRDLQSSSGRLYEGKELQMTARARIELTFDYENSEMQKVILFSTIFSIIIICLVVIQLALLIYKNVGLLTFWILFDYAQLVAFLPLHNARFVPWVYEAFRPFLITHLIFFWPGDPGYQQQVSSDYFNLSFQAYDMDQNKLIEQSALIWIAILGIIFLLDMMILVIQRTCKPDGNYPKCFKFWTNLHEQFRWNIYIRFLMMAYFDLVFIAGIVLFDMEQDVLSFRGLLAMVVLTFTVFLPWMILFYLCAKFDRFQNSKSDKQHFNTLLLKVDKENRWRIFLPCFFFFRRFMTAMILFLGATDVAPDYVQFAVIILLSAILMFYLGKEEPYVTRRLNMYVLSMELFYFMLGMIAFAFTDAVPAERNIKTYAAVCCLVILCLFVLSNFIVSFYFAKKGRVALRTSDINHKEWRRAEVLRRANENDGRKIKRKRKKQKERDGVEMKRLRQLEDKRENLRQHGYSEEDINGKLSLEPVEKSGFKFGAVMGKRLVDYGLMSSSTDSEGEHDNEAADKRIEQENMNSQRRDSKLVPSQEQEYIQDFGDGPDELTARKMLSSDRMDRTDIDVTARSDPRPDDWQDSFQDNGEGDGDDDDQYSGKRMSSQVDFEDDQVHRAPNFGAEQQDTDRPMYTEADAEENESMNVFTTVSPRRGRTSNRNQDNRQQRQPVLQEFDDDGSKISNAMSFVQDPWTTQNNITGQSSSQYGMLSNSRTNDERVMNYADQQ